MKKFVLDPAVMKTWPPILWIIFFALIAFLISLFAVIGKLYIAIHILKYYALWAVALTSYIVYRSKHASDTHIHHYTLGMIVLSFTCYQSTFTTVVAGIFNGVMIEGASRWGYDPIWTN
jgi:hypothetical protein